MFRRLATRFCAFLGLVGLTYAAAAEQRSATLTVSVRVIARAVATIDQPSDVLVTSADVERGWVEVDRPIEIMVRTNSSRGYLLRAAVTTPAFESVTLQFGETTMNVAQESWISRERVAAGDLLRIRVKARLAPATPPGRHPLPVAISTAPL